jgi:hypothetical protein
MLRFLVNSIEKALTTDGGTVTRAPVTSVSEGWTNFEVQVGREVFLVTLARVREAELQEPVRLTLPERWQRFVQPSVRHPYDC